jgi:hypothetical protein
MLGFALVRTLCVVTVLSLLALDVRAADVARPAGAGSGETVAKVKLVGGTGVRIAAGTTSFAPRPTMPLVASDKIVVPAGEFVVVHLVRNNHLVRLDDDVTLRVADIVLLRAPAATESLSAQLERLVSRDEQRSAERIAGTYAGQAAGDAAPPQRTSKPAAGAPHRAMRKQEMGNIDGLIDDNTSGGGLRSGGGGSGTGSGSGAGSGRIGGGGVGSAPPPAAAKPPPPPPAPAPAPPPPTPAPPAAAAAPAPSTGASAPGAPPPPQNTGGTGITFAHDELRACIKAELKRLGVKLPSLTLRLRVEAGKVKKVGMQGGLTTPACAKTLLVGHDYFGPDQTWQDLVLTLE